MFNFEKIIGKKVFAIKGYDHNANPPHAFEGSLEKIERLKKVGKDIEASYILFDDGETVIILYPQDPYAYHDCSDRAREIEIKQSKELWNNKINNKDYGDADKDI